MSKKSYALIFLSLSTFFGRAHDTWMENREFFIVILQLHSTIFQRTQDLRKKETQIFYIFFFKVQSDSDLGVCHGDDHFYFFSSTLPMLKKLLNRDEDEEMVEKMVTLWTNFAKSTTPTPSPGKIDRFKFWRSGLSTWKYQFSYDH